MIGIYKYTNKINGHCYIGQSINLEKRQYCHKSSSFNANANDYNSQFHQAVRKYGWDNFAYEILAELTPEEYTAEGLNTLERYFIKQYDSFRNGYNATEGGDDNPNKGRKGSLNGRALLTEEDVYYIRECYNSHIPFQTVFEEYKDKISKRGLQNVWWFKTWKHIHPEYHSEENRQWHATSAKANPSEVAANNKRSFSEAQVKIMRQEYDNGMTPREIWRIYAPDKAWSTVYNVVTR